MSLKEQLIAAAKPFLKESLDSSKEIIATNSTSFDELGMNTNNPGEFAPEEITNRENLVNVAKISNDNDFKPDDGNEDSITMVSISKEINPTLPEIVNLGNEVAAVDSECKPLRHMIADILRNKDSRILESLNEETDLDEMATFYNGVIPDNKKVVDGIVKNGGPSKAANSLMAWLSQRGETGSHMDDILAGKHIVPDEVKAKWPEALNLYKQYAISNIGSPKYTNTIRKLALDAVGNNPDEATKLINAPTEEFCQKVSEALNNMLRNKIDLSFTPGENLLQVRDKFAQNYKMRKAFENAYTMEKDSKTAKDLENWLNTPAEPVEVPNPFNLSDEDIALLKNYNIASDDPKAKAFLKVLKPKAKAKESVLAESDYAGNLSYNPDKRLNASDILNAVKNAVKKELAPALSVNKDVDENEEPSYIILNIDEKDLPEKIEIDTNTDKNVVLKKHGRAYKFDKE